MKSAAPTAMSLPKLEAFLDAFGGNPDRWPADRRSAAWATLTTDVRAWRMLRSAQAFDRMLDCASRCIAGQSRTQLANAHAMGTTFATYDCDHKLNSAFWSSESAEAPGDDFRRRDTSNRSCLGTTK